MTRGPSLQRIAPDVALRESESDAVSLRAPCSGENATLLPGTAASTAYVVLRLEDPADLTRLACWPGLLEASESAEKIYQSPAFLDYLQQGPQGERFRLYSVSRSDDGQIVGLVPVGLVTEKLDLGVAALAWLSPRLPVVRLFGSVALLHDSARLADQVVAQLFAQHPEAAAISMQAVPTDSAWWEAIRAIAPQRARAYVLNGWRNCHTITLPATFKAYLKQFSAKKRYNLNRQVRQLEKAAGPISVQRVVDAGDVALMYAAADSLASRQQRAGLLSLSAYASLADSGLMLSYVISCGGTVCGVVIGSAAAKVWHVHKILWANEYAPLSIGTSVLHLSIADAIDGVAIERVDLGYGTPSREFSSSHRLKQRGHVLLYRPTLRNRAAILLHAIVTGCLQPLRRKFRHLHKQLIALRDRLASAIGVPLACALAVLPA